MLNSQLIFMTRDIYSKILVAIFLLQFNLLFAQEAIYKKAVYEWDASMYSRIEPEENFKNEDAIILSRKIVAKLPEIENDYIVSYNKNFYLSKTSRILINTAEGVKKYSTMYLPEAVDLLIDPAEKKFCYGYSDWYNVSNHYRIMLFALRVMKKNGGIRDLAFTDENEIDSLYNTRIPLARIRTNFKIQGLQIGDELQIFYKLEIPIENNLAYRFLFNDIYPIQNFELSVSYLKWTRPLVELKNGAEFTYDSTTAGSGREEKKTLTWKRKNLNGYNYASPYATCASVAYADFELFSGIYDNKFIIEDLVFHKTNSYTVFSDCIGRGKVAIDARMLRYEYFVNFQHKTEDKAYYLSKNTDQNLGYRHFYKKILEDSSATNDFAKMIAIHNKLNTLKPLDYKITRSDPHMLALYWFSFLERDFFRIDYDFTIYSNLFYRLDSTYYYVCVPDKRYKRFNTQSAGITTPTRDVFAFKMNDNFYYLYPQNYYSKYNFNELPFYFEDQMVLHIPRNLKPIENCSDITNEADIIYKNTPESQAADNYRQIAGVVNIDLQNKKLKFKGKVSLSGQYSTLLRNFYANNLIDPTINELYKKRMSDNADNKTIQYSLLSTSTEFPFKTYYSSAFEIPTAIQNLNESYAIEINNWFTYVYPDTNFVNTKNRQFDFYPDFLSNDKFKYQLSFDKTVEIKNIDDFKIDVDNNYATFHCLLAKSDDTHFMFDTFLEIKQDKVEAKNVKQVQEITRAIDKLNSSKLIIKQM